MRNRRWAFRKFDWVLIALAWAAALGLGYTGFAAYFHGRGVPVTVFDRMYFTAQLITLESGSVTAPVPWQLEISRFLLPVLAAFTALKTLAAVFLEQAQSLRLLFIKGHVLICGLNGQALLLAHGFINQGKKVVMIAGQEGESLVEEARSSGILVIRGDPERAEVLQFGALRRASRLVCVHQDDRLNAETAVRAQELMERPGAGILPAYVHIVHPQLWHVLQTKALGTRDFASLRLEIFNIYDRGAKLLLQETLSVKPLLDWPAAKLLVVGMGNLGQALVVHAARAAIQTGSGDGSQLQVMVIDRDGAQKCAELQSRYPCLEKTCRLVPLDLDFSSAAFTQGSFLYDGGGEIVFDAIYSCMENDSLNLDVLLGLYPHLQHQTVPVFIRSQKRGGPAGFLQMDTETQAFNPLHFFPLLERTSTPEVLEEGIREVLAISLHQEYVRSQLRAGADPSAVLQAWQDLSEEMREANRRQVDRMQSHFMDIGRSIVPDPDWGEQIQGLSDDEVEKIARREHEGWCADLRGERWTHAPGPKNPERKTHPALVPWEDLAETDREKNRIPVREFPQLLARLGFRIVRV